jgi:serine/threonine protein kinase
MQSAIGDSGGMATSSQATQAAETSLGSDGEAGPSTGLFMPSAAPNSPLALYQPVRFLGRGGFGFVVLAINRATGETVAIKFVECK